jgi:hypothetical protein
VPVVWVAWMVSDFELMIVVGSARLVEVLVTVLVGPVTDCVLVAVVFDSLLVVDVAEVVVLWSFAAALDAESTTFCAALDTAPLVDPAPHALSGTVRIASASAPESNRIRNEETPGGFGRRRGQDQRRLAPRERFMLGGMLSVPPSARNGVRRFARRCWHHPARLQDGGDAHSGGDVTAVTLTPRVRWSAAGTLSMAGGRSRGCDSYQRA